MIDLIIKNGLIVDGTGNPPFTGDVVVSRDYIIDVLRSGVPQSDIMQSKCPGEFRDIPAAHIIDASGMVVAPGFIDIHSHSDENLLADPRAESKIRQGITTEVVGNCGSSLAPLAGAVEHEVRRGLEALGIKLTWRGFGEYLEALSRRKTAVNVAALVGHGTIRSAIMGFESRTPSPGELKAMKDLIIGAMDEGAWGLSTGLIYPPSSYASLDELVELARVVGRRGGIYASHIRNEDYHVVEATREAISIGEMAGIPVQISHHKASSRANWGKVAITLAMMDEAREKGNDVTCDVYPYTASSTGLSVVLPQWLFEGGRERLLERLRDRHVLDAIRDEVEKREGQDFGWENVVVSTVSLEKNKALEGKSILDIARERGREPFDTVIELLLEEGGEVQTVRFGMCEEDVTAVLCHPESMIGTDAGARAQDGPLSKGKPHPRSYGAFPRVLARYVREMGALTLEEAVRKMTFAPARKIGLKRRGVLAKGMFADITIFDPARVADCATYSEPHQYAAGVEYVIVNGVIVVEKGRSSGRFPGRSLAM
ncbi:MAG TPA: D-aminoacylase [Firmicutes bacterium]|nr:D-aminoacylase [Bacillota bacterium]